MKEKYGLRKYQIKKKKNVRIKKKNVKLKKYT